MAYIRVGDENSAPIELYYEDQGPGQPVVLIHGWPLSGAAWEKQVLPLLYAGHRVVTYDRRGFGRSSHPSNGYDYETLTEDLNKIMTKLHLRDAILIGHSMGTGEVTHYLGKFGSERVNRAILIGVLPPFVLKTPDNPTGVDGSVFEGIMTAIAKDRFAYAWEFVNNFYNADVLGGDRVSTEALRHSWNIAVSSSAKAMADCVPAWETDFRNDLPLIDVPVLLIHGDSDRILPIESTAIPFNEAVPSSRLVTIRGGPHGVAWTHADQVNEAILEFIQEPSRVAARM